MNIEEYLSQFDNVTKDPTLDAMAYFMEEFGHPEKQVKFIHIAGTNGKGSTCEMVNNVLANAGYRVGRYISPHLVRYNERITVNNEEIKDEEMSEILERISKKIDKWKLTHDTPIKEFEIVTTLALIYFAEKNCDFAVLETGLGGIYDCTNIVEKSISIITDIGFDHMDILGNTIEEITWNKAGIIKQDCDTVMYEQGIPTEIVKKTCLEKNNTLHLVDKNDIKNYSYNEDFQIMDYKSYKNIKINLKGECQTYNASLVLECIDILKQKGYNISDEAVNKGLSTVAHKATFETLSKNPVTIYDGGHNETAIKNLKNMLEQYYPKERKIYILSILKTKDYKKVIELLTEDKSGIFIFTSGNDENKYVSKEDLYNEAKKYLSENIYKSDLEEAIRETKKCKDKIIMIIR